MKLINSIISLIVWIIICMLAGVIGSRYMPGDWYESLEKPSFNPPNSVFAPVWTSLYILMGISAWIVWKTKGFKQAGIALAIFIIQLILNALWSYLFFGIHNIALAFLDIVILWILILASIILFFRISVVAGILLIPYILWVSFASVLNYSLWKLNS